MFRYLITLCAALGASCLFAADSTGSMYRADPGRSGNFMTASLDVFTGVEWSMSLHLGARCSPVGTSDRIVVSDVLGGMCAIERATGSLLWLGERNSSVFDTAALVESTSRGYLGCDKDLLCFSIIDGSEVWRITTSGQVLSSPVVFNDFVYSANVAGEVFAVDANTGAVQWTKNIEGQVQGSPSIDGGQVFCGNHSGDVVCMNLVTGNEVWRVSIGQSVRTTVAANGTRLIVGADHGVCALDQNNGSVLWAKGPFMSAATAPAVALGKVYCGEYFGRLYCFDEVTGDEDWSFILDGQLASNPVIAGNTVYVGTATGTVYAFDRLTGTVLWQFYGPGPILSDPWVDSARVYIISGTEICALQ